MSGTITLCFRAVPLVVFIMLILNVIHFCMLRNSVNVQDIFMQFYRNMYEVKTTCCTQE